MAFWIPRSATSNQKPTRCGLMGSLLLAVLAGCGGGGNSTPAPTVKVALAADCAGAQCASNGNHYAGSGTGVWAAVNASDSIGSTAISLDGLPDTANITLVLTNQGTTDQPIPTNAVSGKGFNVSSTTVATTALPSDIPFLSTPALPAVKPATTPLLAHPAAATSYAVGAQRSWSDELGTPRSFAATLVSQGLLSNGKHVNIWVENAEWGVGKVTQSLADQLSDAYARHNGVFDQTVTLMGGQPWGPHNNSSLIAPDQDIQLVLANIGASGYFWSGNNYLRSSITGSNESLCFFLSAPTLYDPDKGAGWLFGVMAHESVHMWNFYQRGVLMNARYDSWLEEATAVIAQDIYAGNSFNGTPGTQFTDPFFREWLQYSRYSTCRLTDAPYAKSCDYTYPGYGTFGTFLLRQYGMAFYRDLRLAPATGYTSSVNQIDALIRKYDPGSSFNTALRRWGASLALLDASALPLGYGYPERADSVGTQSYVLPAINGRDYASTMSYPSAFPATLPSYAHTALRLKVTGGVLNATVLIPPQSSLTVVVN